MQNKNIDFVCVDVGSWDEGCNENDILIDVLSAIKKHPKEIWITGSYTKWCQTMEHNVEFAKSCLEFTFKNNGFFTDDGGNKKNYAIYKSLIYGCWKTLSKDQLNVYKNTHNLVDELKDNY